jgi:hypothetical protein
MLYRAGILALATATAPSSCFGDGRANAHHPGTDLGSFQVTGTITTNSCGAGALGEQDIWAFPLRLSRAEGILYWDNGQAVIPGTLEADGVTFSLDTSVIMNMRDPNKVGPLPCSVSRADHAEGTLSSATDPVSSFTGELTYQFSPTAGSSCDDLVNGAAPVLAALPCMMSYALSGQHP